MTMAFTKLWFTGFITAVLIAVIFSTASFAQDIAPVEHKVEITRFKFVPDKLTVRVGDTIVWSNSDIAPHTATAKDKSWDTGTLKRGEQKSVLVTKGFVNSYFCRFHPVMKARLNISAEE